MRFHFKFIPPCPYFKGRSKLTEQREMTNFYANYLRGREKLLKLGLLIQQTVTTLAFSGSNVFLEVFLSSL